MGLWQSSHALQHLERVQCCATQYQRGEKPGPATYEPQQTFVGTTDDKVYTYTSMSHEEHTYLSLKIYLCKKASLPSDLFFKQFSNVGSRVFPTLPGLETVVTFFSYVAFPSFFTLV